MKEKLSLPEMMTKTELVIQERERQIEAQKKSSDQIIKEKDRLLAEKESKYQRIVDEVEKKAFYNGQLCVWQSLAISLSPYSKKVNWFRKDWYVLLQIKVFDHVFFSHHIRTHESLTGFAETFAAIEDLTSVLPYFKVIRVN